MLNINTITIDGSSLVINSHVPKKVIHCSHSLKYWWIWIFDTFMSSYMLIYWGDLNPSITFMPFTRIEVIMVCPELWGVVHNFINSIHLKRNIFQKLESSALVGWIWLSLNWSECSKSFWFGLHRAGLPSRSGLLSIFRQAASKQHHEH